MRILLALLTATFAVAAFGGDPPVRVDIYLLDPRGAIAGETTMPIEWERRTADLIATRRLNVAEAKKLRVHLREELTDDDNVPFCGHSPAYAVKTTPEGQPPTTVTLCETCGTWAQKGELRVLKGKASLEYLDTLLPLPDVFRPVDGKPAKILMPFYDGEKLPFYQLSTPDGG